MHIVIIALAWLLQWYDDVLLCCYAYAVNVLKSQFLYSISLQSLCDVRLSYCL